MNKDSKIIEFVVRGGQSARQVLGMDPTTTSLEFYHVNTTERTGFYPKKGWSIGSFRVIIVRGNNDFGLGRH